jgi:putative transcriptional regulator
VKINLPINTDRQARERFVPASPKIILIQVLLAILLAQSSMAAEDSGWYKLWLPFDVLTSLKDPHDVKTKEKLAKGKFLVANQKLKDPNFFQTVVLLIKYGQEGAMGLVINRPSEVKLATLFPDIKELEQKKDTIYIGGPVAINSLTLLVKSTTQPKESMHVFQDIYISSSLAELKRMIEDAAKNERFRIYAGYAGWAPKQLEVELSRGDWHVLKADVESVFDKKPLNIWQELIHRISIRWVQVRAPCSTEK